MKNILENSKGCLYVVNNEYADREATMRLDESIGVVDRKRRYRLSLLYPVEGAIPSEKAPYFEYGQEVRLPLPFKTIRYLAAAPYAGRGAKERLISQLSHQADRWVATTAAISSKPSDGGVESACSISIPPGKLLPTPTERSKDASIRLLTTTTGGVDVNPRDKVYLLLYAEASARDMEIDADPFPGLRVRVNGRQIGGAIKSRHNPQRLRHMPYSFGEVTERVRPGDNAIQWETQPEAYRIAEAVLVREADEVFPGAGV
jgi:hypothetical protein